MKHRPLHASFRPKPSLLLLLLLAAAYAAMAQQYIGCRLPDGWAETPLLRKNFSLSASDFRINTFQSPAFAIDVVSMGYHELYVNGTKVDDHVMQPAVSQLDRTALRVRYDISPFLHIGDNEVLLWIGQGWGRIYGTSAAVSATVWRLPPSGDSSSPTPLLITDSSWWASPSGYSYSGSWQPLQFGGERFDARISPVWRPAAVCYDDTIAVAPQQFEGNRIVDSLSPASLALLDDSTLLVDFGRVTMGWLQCRFPSLPSGSMVRLLYLDDLNATYSETDTYIARGSGSESFSNRFHLHAFRYLRICSPYATRMLDSIDVKALQISAVNPHEGATFECSDPRLNAIHDMVKYTLSNLTFSGYMVDCPHLERMGYGGDGNASSPTLQTLWNVDDTYRNWLSAWKDAIQPDGELPYVAPAFRTGGGPYWSSFIVKAPWLTYLNYDDLPVVADLYPLMQRWMRYLLDHSVDGILQPWPDNERHTWFLGDWLAPAGVDIGGESVLHVSSCVVAECLDIMSRMAALLHRDADGPRYAALRDSVKASIHRHFYHPETHTYANGTPLDQSYALLLDIPPDSAVAAAVTARLINDCRNKYNSHLAVGLVGVPVFTEWCIRHRQTQLLAAMLRQTDCPGYLYMIRNGATTTWESWGCTSPSNPDEPVRSHVHNCYNGIGIWFYQALAGIRPDDTAPGYKHFFIDPQPCPDVTWIRASKPTPYGTIQLEITESHLSLTVPPATSATLFPNTPHQTTLPPGTHHIPLPPGTHHIPLPLSTH